MAGGSAEHATIAGNLYMALRLQFRSGPCTVYNSDMRVRVAEETYYYPDVTVTCNVDDRRRGVKMIHSPRLVVEVLSPSTEKVDRTEKLFLDAQLAITEKLFLDAQLAIEEIYQEINFNEPLLEE